MIATVESALSNRITKAIGMKVLNKITKEHYLGRKDLICDPPYQSAKRILNLPEKTFLLPMVAGIRAGLKVGRGL